MIRTFANRMTQRLFYDERVKELPPGILRSAKRKLFMIHAATRIDDLRVPPGNRLEKLYGTRSGQYSIRINDQWRVCFQFDAGQADAVEIVDYHGER